MKFLNLPDEYSSENSDTIIIPIPYEGNLSYKIGTSKGPDAIIKASHELEYYDDELNSEPFEKGIHTAQPLIVKNSEEFNIIENKISTTINNNKFFIAIGGSHAITPAIIKPLKEKYPDLSVLQLDAHADLREEFEGDKFNHACPIKRIIDMNIPIVQVGIRSMSYEENELIKAKRIPVFYARDIYDSFDDKLVNKILESLSENVFITIDVDVFDPSLIPSTGTPEPGGLNWYQVIRLLQRVIRKKNVIGADVVELSPIENMHAPDFTIAKMIYKIIGYRDL